MIDVNVSITHNGKTYGGQIATISDTSLRSADHGIVTAYLSTKWNGGGIGVGGYCLDEPLATDDGNFIKRVGTAYGLDHLMRIMETVGVDKWEDLPGKHVIVLFEGKSIFGKTAAGIAGITNEKVLIFKEHADGYLKENEQ